MSVVFSIQKKSLCNWEMLLTGIIFALDCRKTKMEAVIESHEECCTGLLSCESGGRVCLFLSVDADCERVRENKQLSLLIYAHAVDLASCTFAVL